MTTVTWPGFSTAGCRRVCPPYPEDGSTQFLNVGIENQAKRWEVVGHNLDLWSGSPLVICMKSLLWFNNEPWKRKWITKNSTVFLSWIPRVSYNSTGDAEFCMHFRVIKVKFQEIFSGRGIIIIIIVILCALDYFSIKPKEITWTRKWSRLSRC